MNLWIRSQDKRTLINTKRVDVDDTNIIVWDEGKYASEIYLGTYKSKERALEVLDEIDNVKWWKYMASLNFEIFIKTLEKKYSEAEQKEIFKMMNTYEMPVE